MVKEPKNIDFYTTGRQPTQLDFERISKWISKKRKLANQSKKQAAQQKIQSKQKMSRDKTSK